MSVGGVDHSSALINVSNTEQQIITQLYCSQPSSCLLVLHQTWPVHAAHAAASRPAPPPVLMCLVLVLHCQVPCFLKLQYGSWTRRLSWTRLAGVCSSGSQLCKTLQQQMMTPCPRRVLSSRVCIDTATGAMRRGTIDEHVIVPGRSKHRAHFTGCELPSTAVGSPDALTLPSAVPVCLPAGLVVQEALILSLNSSGADAHSSSGCVQQQFCSSPTGCIPADTIHSGSSSSSRVVVLCSSCCFPCGTCVLPLYAATQPTHLPTHLVNHK